MAYTYEDVVPTLIENTTMKKRLLNGVHKTYVIKAVDGYALHDKRVDDVMVDQETGEETIIPTFKTGETTVAASYDFSTVTQGTYTYVDENEVEVTIPVSMVGVNEFYTVPEEIVSENQLMGVTPNHEVTSVAEKTETV